MFVYKWKGHVGGHELCDACPGAGGSGNSHKSSAFTNGIFTPMKTKAGLLSINFEDVMCLVYTWREPLIDTEGFNRKIYF